jgi:hypothetical protein
VTSFSALEREDEAERARQDLNLRPFAPEDSSPSGHNLP